MSRRSCVAVLFGTLIIYAATGLSYAAVITADLQQALRSAGSAGEVSVIINLADRVDLNAIMAGLPDQKAGNDKVRKRKAMVDALKAKASLTQGFLKPLLANRGAKKIKPLWITNSIASTVPASIVSELMTLSEIENIELDAVIQAPIPQPPSAAPLAPLPPPYEPNISLINAPDLWNSGVTGAGAVVANMDTGVDINHPDLQSRWLGGPNSWFNPYSEPANAGLCASPGNCGTCELSSVTPCDTNGHGTGTMGLIVGGNAGGTAIGVAPDAKWIAVKIFPDGNHPSAQISIVLEGFQWLINLPEGSAADIINNSWGMDNDNQCSTVFQTAITTLKTAGIEVVFSAGNRFGAPPSSSQSPANNPGAVAVGAVDNSKNLASFSVRGPSACDGSIFPHVVAPGVNINLATLATLNPPYASRSGTSFSAPHVSGAMALLLSAFPTLTPAEIETAFEQTAVPLPLVGTTPNNDYGYGLIDVSGALSFITTHGYISIPQLNAWNGYRRKRNTAIGEENNRNEKRSEGNFHA